jgi:hypothetical protein
MQQAQPQAQQVVAANPNQRPSNRPPAEERNAHAFGMPMRSHDEEVPPATQIDPPVGLMNERSVSDRPPPKDRHVSEMPAFLFQSAVAPGVPLELASTQEDPHKAPASIRAARLTILRGPGQGGAATLEQTNVIGNLASECSLVVHDPRIASRHIEIARRPDGYWARDLGSDAGTTRRGQRLSPVEPVKLVHGDVLILASSIELLYQEEGAQAS